MMSEAFKEKLRKYAAGELSAEEQSELEQELEKLEAYQDYLNETMTEEPQEPKELDEVEKASASAGAAAGLSEPQEQRSSLLEERRIIRRSKWKARLVNTLSVVVIVIVCMIAGGIVTSTYYGYGDDSRLDELKDVAQSAIALTHPNTVLRSEATSLGWLLNADVEGQLYKQVGGENIKIGSLSATFILNRIGKKHMSWDDTKYISTSFYLPEGDQVESSRQWERLRKLPEGTVAEAAVSFDHYYSLDEVLRWLEGRNLRIEWFAVKTGGNAEKEGWVTSPVGFPFLPIWHADDWEVISKSEEKLNWFIKTGSMLKSAPSIDEYGDSELREANFVKTLQMLSRHPQVTAALAPFLNVQEVLDYISSNGVRLYGAVVTGPTKEVLALERETMIKHIEVGETRLWNWD